MSSALVRLSLLLLAGAGSAAAGWRGEPPLPRALAGAAAASTGDAGWIVGGTWWEAERKQVGTALYRCASGQTTWSIAGELPGGFAHGGFAGDGQTLWLAGGMTRTGVSAQVLRLDLAAGRATEFAHLGEPRVHCGATLLDGALWVVGGTSAEDALARADGAAWRVDLSTGTVSALPPGPPWINPLVLALDGRLHVLPGGVWVPARGRLEPPTRVAVYHPAERRWETRPLPQPLPRGLAGVALDGNRAFLAGGVELRGVTPAITRATWLYRGDHGSLAPLPPLPAPRLAAMVLRTDEGLLVLGGEDRPRGRAATVWRLAGKDLP